MPACFNVLFPTKIYQAYSYIMPASQGNNESYLGMRVIVPFANYERVGIIISSAKLAEGQELKSIIKVLDSEPFLPPNLLPLIQFIANYYMAPLGDVLRLVIPNGTLPYMEKTVSLTKPFSLEEAEKFIGKSKIKYSIFTALKNTAKLSMPALEEAVGKSITAQVNELSKIGIVTLDFELKDQRISEKFVDYVNPLPADFTYSLKKNAYKQLAIIQFLQTQKLPIPKNDLIRLCGFSRSALNQLISRNIVSHEAIEIERKAISPSAEHSFDFPLTDEQRVAVNSISESLGHFQPFLLFGITGSGKTLVYINILHQVLSRGETAIVLIPEISLTPQTVARFRAHFGDTITIINSRMTDGERYDAWRHLRDGRYKIVIGPRSAIVAPLINIGIIIVDEEHEWSYKQTEQSPRYNARDVAVYRAQQENCPVLLGSATPSLESFTHACNEKYTLLKLKKRPQGAELPQVDIIDLKDELEKNPIRDNVLISTALENEIEIRLLKKEQIILFQNRRGYSANLCCESCGHVQECPNCSISLVYHKHGRKLTCHYCDFKTTPFTKCQKCRNTQLRFGGFGTQKIEEYLHERFAGSNIERMDLDTTRGKNAHATILKKFEEGRIDILLGTQMITKGLDFPNVTLVGVLSADASLSIPDFRSTERTYQLLSQVSGRSGRGRKAGLVLIQTFQPEHYVIKHSQQHSFIHFYEEETAFRETALYPPYGRIINLNFSSENSATCEAAASFIASTLRSIDESEWVILGPTPSIIEKIKNKYRWQVLIKFSVNSTKQKKLKLYLNQLKDRVHSTYKNLIVKIDVDPYDLL